eukprot:Opistho-2@28319
MAQVQQWLQALASAVRSKNGAVSGALLSLSDAHTIRLRELMNLNQASLDMACESALSRVSIDAPYDEIAKFHVKCVLLIAKGNAEEAYTNQASLVGGFLRTLPADSNWWLDVLRVIDLDLRRTAVMADEQLARQGKKASKLDDAARVLMRCFTVVGNDRSPLETSKKWGTLQVVNNLFKIYFRLNNHRLCKNIIRSVESPGFPDLAKFKIGDVVTYRFFAGRYVMFDSNYREAEKHLSAALEHCHRDAVKNKRLIVMYLTPVKLLLGRLPTEALLRKYGLFQFVDIVRAVRTGNLLLLNNALRLHQAFFVQRGIYLILEKLKTIVYRNLFKRVHLICGTNKLPLSNFIAALGCVGVTMDRDEIECVIANLIHQKYIKGYLHHTQGFLVLSQTAAFPPLAGLL